MVVHSPGVMQSAVKPEAAALGRMLQAGLARLTGATDARAALAKWIRPADTVGLKVNCLAGRQMSTHLELTEELVGCWQPRGCRASRHRL